ncbi:MAG TPA: hypothetical protein VIV12_14930, partial [Streptosporangiaceae bacterium]
MERALDLFENAPSSADKAEAWFHYQGIFMFHAQGRIEPGFAAASRALKIAEEAGADALIPRYLSVLARYPAFRGQLEEGFAILRRGRALAEASGNGAALLWMAGNESAALLGTGQFERAAEVALRGFRAAHQTGLDAWSDSVVSNACEALLPLGRTADAAALIGPLTSGPPDRGHWVVHQCRAEIDLLRGDIEAATQRQQRINPITSRIRSLDVAPEAGQRAAGLALWVGRPGDALQEVNRVLGLFEVPDLTILCGRLLAAG